MSLHSSIAIEGELKRLLKFLEDRENLTAEELLEQLRKEMEETIEAAETGWL